MKLVQALCSHFPIKGRNIVAFAEVAHPPGRHLAPGPKFDWNRLENVCETLPTLPRLQELHSNWPHKEEPWLLRVKLPKSYSKKHRKVRTKSLSPTRTGQPGSWRRCSKPAATASTIATGSRRRPPSAGPSRWGFTKIGGDPKIDPQIVGSPYDEDPNKVPRSSENPRWLWTGTWARMRGD